MKTEEQGRRYEALRAHIHNAKVRALAYCYESADASGYPWTTEGLGFTEESFIIYDLQRLGVIPSELPYIPDVKRESLEKVHEYWAYDDGEDYEDHLEVQN